MESSRQAKTQVQRTLDKGRGVEVPLASGLPLLTADTVSGRCGSLGVGGCVSGPFRGVSISTPD